MVDHRTCACCVCVPICSRSPPHYRARTLPAAAMARTMALPAPFQLPGLLQVDSTLLRSLGCDSGSRFCFFVMLQLSELATLSRCCLLMRSWLYKDNAIGKRRLEIEPEKLPTLFGRWICKHIGRLVLKPCANSRRAIPALDEFRQRANEFSVLQHLSLSLGRTVEASIPQCIEALGPRLQSLSVSVQLTATADLAAVIRSVSACVHLCEFVLCGEFHNRNPPAIDLSPLVKLPLRTLNIRQSKDARWTPTAQQVNVIVAVGQTLSKLNAGTWDAAMLAELVKAKRASPVPLTRFQLNHSAVDSGSWAQLCQLPTLQLLFPGSWRPLSTQAWSQLPRFRNLQSLFIGGVMHHSGLQTEHFLPALLQCRTVSWLQLGAGLTLSGVQLQSIVESLPRLNRLVLQDLCIDSLAPLADGSDRLMHLELLRLRTFDDTPLSARELLPRLPRLSFLRIFDADRLTEEEVMSDNAALLLRQPLLLPKCFEQNLRQLWM